MTVRTPAVVASACVLVVAAVMGASPATAEDAVKLLPHPRIEQATLGEAQPITPEVSTQELLEILAAGTVPVLDVRSAQEYAIAHIPGTINLYEKELEAIVARYPKLDTALVLYCNGPYCGKSKRLSEQLVKKGYTGVRRYQLGLPVWRALGHTVQTDLRGFEYIFANDRTAVFVDARRPEAFKALTVPGAVSIRLGESETANEDGRLPYRDKGTRVVVFGSDAKEARAVAEEVARKAYWNSSYFGGSFEELATITEKRQTTVQ
jgi:rhodanese-related sulfurtransferase